jgi:hypothetical protein
VHPPDFIVGWSPMLASIQCLIILGCRWILDKGICLLCLI